ncbi:MAG: MBL fold metallo-hydrolase [Thermoanaerobaculia bacterium]
MNYDPDMESPKLEEHAIGDRVRVWTLGGDQITSSYGANCVGILGDDGVLLVDPLIAPAHAKLVEAALRKQTDAPVRFVLLTHHHTDHALGSSWFARQGAAVIAHEACRRGMEQHHPALLAQRRKDPELAKLFSDAETILPTITFPATLTLDLGGVEARILHPGHGHTPGDAVLFLPGESVAVCGDLVSSGYHVNFEDASLPGATAGLEFLASLGAETYVPGHGRASGKTILEDQKWYHAAIDEAVREGDAGGRDLAETTGVLKKLFPGFLLEMVLPETVARLSPRRTLYS